MGVIRIRGRVRALGTLAHDPRFRVVLDAVLDAVQVAGEPPVHQLQRRRPAVTSLMEVGLRRYALGLEVLVDPHTVLGHHVPVVERVGHERRRLDPVQVVLEVARRPELAVVTGDAVHAVRQLSVADHRVAVVAPLGVAAVDEVIQDIHVLAQVTTRVPHEAVGAVVAVVGRVGRDRDDAL